MGRSMAEIGQLKAQLANLQRQLDESLSDFCCGENSRVVGSSYNRIAEIARGNVIATSITEHTAAANYKNNHPDEFPNPSRWKYE